MTEETGRPQAAVAVVLVAAIAAVVYLLTPLARRIGRGTRSHTGPDLRGAVEDLGDRVGDLTRKVGMIESQFRGSEAKG